MTSYEKAEIRRLPRKYRPMTAWGYIWRNLLYSLPVLGWIFLIVHATSDKNIARRSYARSFLLLYLILIIVSFVLGLLIGLGVLDAGIIEDMSNSLPSDI
jgi:hypothetical protein